jgi:hypothetical protein
MACVALASQQRPDSLLEELIAGIGRLCVGKADE